VSRAGQRQRAHHQQNQKFYELGVKFGKNEIPYESIEGMKATKYAWSRFYLGIKHGMKEAGDIDPTRQTHTPVPHHGFQSKTDPHI
jgi:hypothetical protein